MTIQILFLIKLFVDLGLFFAIELYEFYFFSLNYVLVIERKGRERNIDLLFLTLKHSLAASVCALTRDRTYNLDVLRWCSNQLSELTVTGGP